MQQPQKKKRTRLTAQEAENQRNRCHNCLVTYIHESAMEPGASLDGERILSQRFGYSLAIVRAALTKLKEEGVVEALPRQNMRICHTPAPSQTMLGKSIAFVSYVPTHYANYKEQRPSIVSHELEKRLSADGGTLLFVNMSEMKNPNLEKALSGLEFDGLIYSSSGEATTQRDLEFLAKQPYPVITVAMDPLFADTVNFDDEEIGRKMAEHIIDLGHKKVCLLESPRFDWSTIRADSAVHEFKRQHQEPPMRFSFDKDTDHQKVEAFIQEQAHQFTACITVNEELAITVLNAARKAEIRVPEDLSVIGADDRPSNRHYNLTTIRLPDPELGTVAYQAIREKILNPQPKHKPKRITVSCPLIVRQTTAVPINE